jgi:hypothetical protein
MLRILLKARMGDGVLVLPDPDSFGCRFPFWDPEGHLRNADALTQ